MTRRGPCTENRSSSESSCHRLRSHLFGRDFAERDCIGKRLCLFERCLQRLGDFEIFFALNQTDELAGAVRECDCLPAVGGQFVQARTKTLVRSACDKLMFELNVCHEDRVPSQRVGDLTRRGRLIILDELPRVNSLQPVAACGG